MVRISLLILIEQLSLLAGVDGADGDRAGRVHPDRGRSLHLHHQVPILKIVAKG